LRAISASAADFLAEDRASAGSLERVDLAGQVPTLFRKTS